MLRHKHIDRICCGVLAATLLLTLGFMGAAATGILQPAAAAGYADMLFDTATVHTIDIVMDDWDAFIETCENEEYADCTVIIDGEKFSNVAIRAKGNTSLSSVSQYGNDRYSFKVEFDHYDDGMTYHGLDKLSLNNLIQDATLMKDYLAYTMMGKMGVASSLCSYAYITVNGEDWGLYLAVEGVEEAFMQRNYGSDYGEMYKPDSMSFGGGRGNGKDFDIEALAEQRGIDVSELEDGMTMSEMQEQLQEMSGRDEAPADMPAGELPEGAAEMMENMEDMFGELAEMFGEIPGMPENAGEAPEIPEGMTQMPGNMGGMGGNGMQMPGNAGGMDFGGGMGSSDVMLQYTDDDPASYSNIFDNAVTDISEADQTRLIAALKALGEGDVSAVDAEMVIRYMAVHDFVRNDDSYTGSMIHNYYLYEKDGVLSMVPWDYNLSFGGFAGGSASDQVNSPIDSPVSGDISTRPMAAWIFADEEYTERYHEVYAELIETVCDSGWLDSEIVRVAELIAPYAQKDPTAFTTYEEFETGVAALREFVSLRAQSVKGQLDGTIPSTDEGQAADPSALIDTGDLNISDMGSMNMGGSNMGGRGGDFGMGRSFGDAAAPGTAAADETAAPDTAADGEISEPEAEQTSAEAQTDEAAAPEGMQMPGNMGEMPEGMQMPENMGEMPGGMQMPGNMGEMPEGMQMPGNMGEMAEGMQMPENMGEMPGGMQMPGNMGEMQTVAADAAAEADVSAEPAATAEAPDEAAGALESTADTPEVTGEPAEEPASTAAASDETVAAAGEHTMRGGNWNFDRTAASGSAAGQEQSNMWLMIACAGVLVIGIIIAALFKGRN